LKSKITFIIGGARSGKSTYAIKWAKECGENVTFIATAQALDSEMKKRIKLHQQERPANWKTLEEPRQVAALLEKESKCLEVIIIDCLTLLVSNLMVEKPDKEVEQEAKDIIKVIRKNNLRAFIVSNEVGLGIVPNNELARKFRDLAGRVNQIFAHEADEVFFMASGLPLKIKGD